MFPHTLLLVVASSVVALAVGLPTGIFSALYRQNPLVDYSSRLIALLGLSMPVFWFGILLLIVFSLHLDLFPLIGGGDLIIIFDMIAEGEVFEYPEDFLAAIVDVLHHLALPALALGLTLAATVSRMARSAMLEVISADYIRTARSKGLHERFVIYKHALRNMMIPLLTIIGLFVAIALTGTVLTETVFTRPGLGKMLVDAIARPRLPAGAGRHHGVHHDDHPGEPAGGYPVRGVRSPHRLQIGRGRIWRQPATRQPREPGPRHSIRRRGNGA